MIEGILQFLERVLSERDRTRVVLWMVLLFGRAMYFGKFIVGPILGTLTGR